MVQSSRRRAPHASVVDRAAHAQRTPARYGMRPGGLGTGGPPDGPQPAPRRPGHTAGAPGAGGGLGGGGPPPLVGGSPPRGAPSAPRGPPPRGPPPPRGGAGGPGPAPRGGSPPPPPPP